MADYYETFDPDPMVSMPAYHVSCKFCGVDLWGRSGQHKPECPRFASHTIVFNDDNPTGSTQTYLATQN